MPAIIRLISSVDSRCPKPGIADGSVKSPAFSASPTKSRIAGSAVHTRRSAARVSSAGTPLRRNAVMSVSALIDSIGGRLSMSKSGSAFCAASALCSLTSGFASAGGSASAFATSRLRRDQRARKSSSVIVISISAARERLGILPVALALEELPLDMVLGDERRNDLLNRLRHRHLLHQIGGAFGKTFAFRRIGRDGHQP